MQEELTRIKDILLRNKNAVLFEEKAFIKVNASTDYFQSDVKEIRRLADEAIKKRPFIPLLSEYKQYMETGLAEEYFILYCERRMYMNALVLMSVLTEEKKYISALENYLWAIINTYKWTTPRDLLFFEEKGKDGVPHEQCLDLNSTETALNFAEVDAILGDKLSPFIRKKMKEAALNRIVYSFANKDYYHSWEFGQFNASAVCGCCVAGTAMYYLDDTDMLAEIIQRILKTMERFLSGYNNDGVCLEGFDYWKYGFGYYFYFTELLRQRTNGEIDLLKNEKVHQIALYMQRCRIGKDVIMNFGDSHSEMTYNIGFIHRLKKRFPDVLIPPAEYAGRIHSDWRYRLTGFVRDYAWFDEEYIKNAQDTLVDQYYFEDSQIYMSHKGNACFAVAGGDNGCPHGHNDLGHFIYYVDGQEIFIDLGQGIYCQGYFGRERGSFLAVSSAGHSLPRINGEDQKVGVQYCASRLQVLSGIDDVVGIDITGAYDCDILRSLYRTFRFREDGSLQVCDSIELTEDAVIVENFVVHTTEKPVWESGRIILKNEEVTVVMQCDSRFELKDIEEIPAEKLNQCHKEGIWIIRMITNGGISGENTFSWNMCRNRADAL